MFFDLNIWHADLPNWHYHGKFEGRFGVSFRFIDKMLLKMVSRGVVVNFDLGERFPKPRFRQRRSLRPRARRVAVRGGASSSVAVT